MERLISADDVRMICLNKATFDVGRFTPYLEVAELKMLKPFLGKDFYAEIKTQYLADSLSTDNAYLVTNYLKKAVAWATLLKALPFLNIDISNSGLQRNNTDFSTQGSAAERADLSTEALGNAQMYFDEAKEYIEYEQTANDKFPLYSGSENVDNNTSIIGGIVLDVDDDDDKNNLD